MRPEAVLGFMCWSAGDDSVRRQTTIVRAACLSSVFASAGALVDQDGSLLVDADGELPGTRMLIPIRQPFPIWRQGFRFDPVLLNWVEDANGWWPDWYRYHESWRIA